MKISTLIELLKNIDQEARTNDSHMCELDVVLNVGRGIELCRSVEYDSNTLEVVISSK